MLIIVSCFSFIGCNNTDDENNPTSSTSLDKVTLNGIEYTLSEDKSYYIVSGQKNVNLKEVVIPNTCNNLPVKEIGQDAFRYSTMEKITLPNSIVAIQAYAFKCSSIKKIDIPKSVTHVGGGAFAYCENLEEAIVRGDDVYVDTFCFSNDYYLKRVLFLGYNINISPNAFSYCSRMVEFVINPAELGDNHFQERYYIDRFSLNVIAPDSANPEAVIIQNNFIEQDGLVFYKYNEKYYLVHYQGTEEELLVLPETIEGHNYSINQYAFYNSVRFLSSVYIPSTVEGIGREAFRDCGNTGFSIYCEAESLPSDWDSEWNYGSYPVTWGYTLG